MLGISTTTRWCSFLSVAVLLGMLADRSDAAIVTIDASVTTSVQELIDGVPGSISNDSAELNSDISAFPLSATSDLSSTGLDGVLLSVGHAFAAVSDPTLLDQPNPEEFAVEVGCYSNGESVSYSISGDAVESRTVLFNRFGTLANPAEINFGLSTTATIESTIFLGGAVVVWSTDADVALDEVLADLDVTVTRRDTGATLFETTLGLSGAGGDGLSTSSTGAIVFETVSLAELADEGVDSESLAILEQVERDGTLLVVVIPPQEHSYTYTVTADQSLVLDAEFEVRLRNNPDGTGVAASLGAPFENLASFIEQGLPGVDGVAFELSINRITESRAIGLVDGGDSTKTDGLSSLCGAFGFEGIALIGFLLIVPVIRRRH